MIEQVNELPVKKTPFRYCIAGPAMSHNYLCAVCKENSAVNEGWSGHLQPCWKCQKSYKLIKLNWFLKLFFR
jgi:hypothetical protein